MPSKSKKQLKFMQMEYARAKEGEPTQTGMSLEQLKHFAETKEKGLPERVGVRRKRSISFKSSVTGNSRRRV